MNILKEEDYIVTEWSGGKTKQLYIYPEESSLQERNFLFRISSATVEVEESKFSKFEGYDRELMVLDGKLEIKHDEHHSAVLNQFDVDSFSGEWNTISHGKVTDFNLIYKKGNVGKLIYLPMVKEQVLEFPHASTSLFAIYVYEGGVLINNSKLIKEGNLLVSRLDQVIRIRSLEDSALIISRISIR